MPSTAEVRGPEKVPESRSSPARRRRRSGRPEAVRRGWPSGRRRRLRGYVGRGERASPARQLEQEAVGVLKYIERTYAVVHLLGHRPLAVVVVDDLGALNTGRDQPIRSAGIRSASTSKARWFIGTTAEVIAVIRAGGGVGQAEDAVKRVGEPEERQRRAAADVEEVLPEPRRQLDRLDGREAHHDHCSAHSNNWQWRLRIVATALSRSRTIPPPGHVAGP